MIRMIRALLIGCSYAGLHVEPSVDAIFTWLIAHGFAEHEIERLTGPQATRDNILAGLEHLAAHDPGEAPVVLYYAGHGHLYRTEIGVEDGHAAHPLLVAVDIDTSAEGSFRGIFSSELSRAVRRLAARARNLTVILDCCHASGMLRLDDDTECDEVRAQEYLLHDEGGARVARKRAPIMRGDHAPSEPLVRLSDQVVVIAASSAGGRAYPDPATERMVFTDALVAALGRQATWDAVLADARASVHAVWPIQQPAVFGPRFRRPFTLNEELPANDLYRVEPRGDDLVLLQGSAGGIHPQDRFALIPLAHASGDAHLGDVAPRRVFAGHTLLDRPASRRTLPPCYARRTRRGTPYSVELAGVDPPLEHVLADIIVCAGLQRGEGDDLAARLVLADGLLAVHDHLGDLVHAVPAEHLDADALRRCLARLDRWTDLSRWLERARALPRLRGCYDIRWGRKGELDGPRPGSLVARPGEVMSVELRNLDGGAPELYAQVFRVRADREVRSWNPGLGPQFLVARQRLSAGSVQPHGERGQRLDAPPALPAGLYREWTLVAVSQFPFDDDLLETPMSARAPKAIKTRGPTCAEPEPRFDIVSLPYTLELLHAQPSDTRGPMTSPTFSDSDLDALALQVDEQLAALSRQTGPVYRGPEKARLSAPEQEKYLAQVTQEPFETFWQKYLRHARRDLCLPDGQLYKQWQRWRDFQSKDAVKMSLSFLAGIGIATSALAPAAVAAAVCLLNIVTKIGIDAICEGCAEAEATRATTPKLRGLTRG